MHDMNKHEYAVLHLLANMLSNPDLTQEYPPEALMALAQEMATDIVGEALLPQ